MSKKTYLIGFLLLISALLWGCGQQQAEGDEYTVYYVNHNETGVYPVKYVTQTTDRDELIMELLEQLGTASERLTYKTPVGVEMGLPDWSVTEDQLIISFDEGYRNQTIITEILGRAAIVRTLTQIEGIQYVAFQIKSEPLLDASGNVIGLMNADMFIDNAGKEINTYEKATLRLYFANESGDGLQVVNRTVVYNSNIAMERLVMEQLIAGVDENENAYSVLNPNTRIVSINLRDGICYVDLDSTFLTPVYNVTSDVTIYSITNSLAELNNVNKVQISVNGSTNVNYRENTSLATVFERNLELVD